MTDFNRSEEAKQIFKEKRKPKNPITFKLTLNEEQKLAKQVILDSPVTLLRGMAGSGKTLVACQVALEGITIPAAPALADVMLLCPNNTLPLAVTIWPLSLRMKLPARV